MPANASSFGTRSCKSLPLRRRGFGTNARTGRAPGANTPRYARRPDAPVRVRPGWAGRDRPCRRLRLCKSNDCRDRYTGSAAGRAARRLPTRPGMLNPCLLPRPGTLNKSRLSHRPLSPPDQAPAPRPATRAVKRPGATSCRAGDDEAASDGAPRDAPPSAANSGFAGTPSSSCNSRRTGGPEPDARGNAAR